MTIQAALCAFSNPIETERALKVRQALEQRGVACQIMPSIDLFTSFEQRGAYFNECVLQGIDYLIDLSGGDLANGILPFIDYEAYRRGKSTYVGYSDCTAVLNALYARTGKAGLLFHAHGDNIGELAALLEGQRPVLDWSLFSGTPQLDVPVIGGNLRCFLKLAGTPYLPEMDGKVLFLEAHSGDIQRTLSLMAQLAQLDTGHLAGICLGQFSELDENPNSSGLLLWALEQAGLQAPFVMRTPQVGHSRDAKGLWIGFPLKD